MSQLELNGSFRVQEVEVKFKRQRSKAQVSLMSSADVANYLRPYMANEPRERLVGLYLNQANDVIAMETISIGTLDYATADPREIFKTAFLTNASAIILAHNHPSGHTEPSIADKEFTMQILEAAQLLRFQLLDSLIIGRDSHYSFADSNKPFNAMKERGRKQ